MNCDEFRSALLSGVENEAMDAHEGGCAACRSQVSGLRLAAQSLSSRAVWEEPPPELAGQVTALIGHATGSSSIELESRISDRRWVAAAGVAASVVLLVGLLGLNRGSGPDWSIDLPATDLAPTAVAAVQGWNESAGTRMLVSIEGLTPAPDGFVYEFWLSDGPLHISAGTFHDGGEIELWSGVTRADFPRLWVTLEAIDEDESPSTHTVLDTGNSSA